MSKILVIGGAGYIGSHVVKSLLNSGQEVTVFDNLSTGLRENLFPQTQFIEGDIVDSAKIDQAMSKNIDGVIHLAAKKAIGESMTNPEIYSVNNICGAINILNSMAAHGVKKIIFSSSAATYGEPQYLPVDEKHPTNPINYYGFTKLEVERLMAWYDQLKGIRFAALRYFNAVGYDVDGRIKGLEKNPGNLLPIVMEAAAGPRDKVQIYGNDYETPDGTCIRDYIHVNDLGDAHVRALAYLTDKQKSLTVNLGTENGISVREIIEAVKRISGRDFSVEIAPRRPGDPPKLIASSQKARELLGWAPTHSDLETIIRSMLGAYGINSQ